VTISFTENICLQLGQITLSKSTSILLSSSLSFYFFGEPLLALDLPLIAYPILLPLDSAPINEFLINHNLTYFA
jgi:hypothetical protein